MPIAIRAQVFQRFHARIHKRQVGDHGFSRNIHKVGEAEMDHTDGIAVVVDQSEEADAKIPVDMDFLPEFPGHSHGKGVVGWAVAWLDMAADPDRTQRVKTGFAAFLSPCVPKEPAGMPDHHVGDQLLVPGVLLGGRPVEKPKGRSGKQPVKEVVASGQESLEFSKGIQVGARHDKHLLDLGQGEMSLAAGRKRGGGFQPVEANINWPMTSTANRMRPSSSTSALLPRLRRRARVSSSRWKAA